MLISCFDSQMWYDYQLVWDPNRYGGLKAVRLPCNQVWKPDIVLLNKYLFISVTLSVEL